MGALPLIGQLGRGYGCRFVKQAILSRGRPGLLLPGRLAAPRAFLSQAQEPIPAVINAEIRESTRGVASTKLSTGHGPTRRVLSLGTRFGIAAALNDHQG